MAGLGRRTHGCNRGLFGLKSWEALPHVDFSVDNASISPSGVQELKSKHVNQNQAAGDSDRDPDNPPKVLTSWSIIKKSKAPTSDIRYKFEGLDVSEEPGEATEEAGEQGPNLLVKYNYKANPNSPLDEKELNLVQGSRIWLVSKINKKSEHFWLARDEQGEEGWVPKDYVLELDEKPTRLPWLKNKTDENANNKPPLPVVKKMYKPTYDHSDQGLKSPKEAQLVNYYCKLCDKQLNGPSPYAAHMTSKAHKEEVAIAKEYGRL